MSCEYQIPGNKNCEKCLIKDALYKDALGQTYIKKTNLPEGIHSKVKPSNLWIGRSKQEIVECEEEITYNVQ